MKSLVICLLVFHSISSYKHNKKRLVKKEDPDTVIFMAYDSNGKLKQNIVKKSEMNNVQTDSCNFARKKEYAFCLALQNCNLCIRAPRCGWCEEEKKCIPTACEKECPAILGHPSMKYYCGYDKTMIYSGSFDRINEESKKPINPEIAKPKIAVTTVKTIEGQVNFQKQIGQQILEEKLSLKNFAGQDNLNKHKISTSPQMANTSVTFPVRQFWNKEYYDMITGQSLAQEKVLHGQDSRKKRRRRR